MPAGPRASPAQAAAWLQVGLDGPGPEQPDVPGRLEDLEQLPPLVHGQAG